MLMPDATPATFPVDVTIQAAGATVAAKGSIANANALTGLNVGADARAWERVLREPPPAPAHDAAVRGVGWRRQCVR